MDWNYIAGFVDGEGSIVKVGETDFRISIPQTHEGVLTAIQGFTGVGNICKVTKRKIHWKESWVYSVARQRDVLFFLKKIKPHLIVKKAIAEKVIPIVENIVLDSIKKKEELQRKIKACKLLRKKGLSYREVGKKLKIDHGYARRLILYK